MHLLTRVEVYKVKLLGKMVPAFFCAGHKVRILFIRLKGWRKKEKKRRKRRRRRRRKETRRRS